MAELTSVTISSKGQISLPKSFRKSLGLKRGDSLVLREENRRLVLEKMDLVARKLSLLEDKELLAAMAASSVSLDEWNSGEDERWNKL